MNKFILFFSIVFLISPYVNGEGNHWNRSYHLEGSYIRSVSAPLKTSQGVIIVGSVNENASTEFSKILNLNLNGGIINSYEIRSSSQYGGVGFPKIQKLPNGKFLFSAVESKTFNSIPNMLLIGLNKDGTLESREEIYAIDSDESKCRTDFFLKVNGGYLSSTCAKPYGYSGAINLKKYSDDFKLQWKKHYEFPKINKYSFLDSSEKDFTLLAIGTTEDSSITSDNSHILKFSWEGNLISKMSFHQDGIYASGRLLNQGLLAISGSKITKVDAKGNPAETRMWEGLYNLSGKLISDRIVSQAIYAFEYLSSIIQISEGITAYAGSTRPYLINYGGESRLLVKDGTDNILLNCRWGDWTGSSPSVWHMDLLDDGDLLVSGNYGDYLDQGFWLMKTTTKECLTKIVSSIIP